jgi:hypothetical protein
MGVRTPITADLAGAEADRALARDPGRATAAHEGLGPILPAKEADRLGARWRQLQTGFVDEPRDVVEHADALVADLMRRVAHTFAEERERLGSHWRRGEDVSTEELRVALQRYRSFFERLLAP